ncbi:hypothetical protein LZ023_38880 (plasmid) [Pseudomonas silvicola]|nr:hypothetical protein LZ023_38880 [Pseudomonas silvicola]
MSDVNIAKEVKIFSELINLAVIPVLFYRSDSPLLQAYSPAMNGIHPTMAATHTVRVKP